MVCYISHNFVVFNDNDVNVLVPLWFMGASLCSFSCTYTVTGAGLTVGMTVGIVIIAIIILILLSIMEFILFYIGCKKKGR